MLSSHRTSQIEAVCKVSAGSQPPPIGEYRLPSRWAAGISLFGFIVLSINLGDVRVLTFHETVFAQPAKEMLRDGNWIVPTIAGVPFTDRTPLTAWLMAGSMTLFGDDGEWVVRFPSVVCAVLTALLIASMAARWFGRRVGILAGFMELTTWQVFAHARLAEADMLLSLTVTAAMYAFAAALVEGPRGASRSRFLPYVFGAAVAASFMVKWIFGPAFIGLGCLAYCGIKRERRAWLFLFHPGAIALALSLTVPWIVLACREHAGLFGEFLNNHFGRFRGTYGAREPWYAYAYLVPFLLLPWFPYAVAAAIVRVRNRFAFEPIWMFFICWFVPGMMLLSVSSFKAKHYTMPLLPPLVVAAAVGLHEYLKRRERVDSRLLPWLAAATAFAGVFGCAFVLVKKPADARAMACVIAVLAGGGATALVLEFRKQFRGELTVLFAALAAAAMIVQTWIMPSHDSFRPLAELGRRINAKIPADAEVQLVHLPEVQIPYYIDRPMRRWDDRKEFLAKADASEPLYIVTSRDFVTEFATQADVKLLDGAERIARHTYDRDRLVLLEYRSSVATAAGEGPVRRK
ncbi:MAG: glycosyltransferase family 39 protein [Planctomycetaceae bacterium]|nr:glycosyltransferase family 39 protein [Planctomycetaceae bacterium]